MIKADSSAWFGPGKEIDVPAEAGHQEYRKALRNAVKKWSRKLFSTSSEVLNADKNWSVLW